MSTNRFVYSSRVHNKGSKLFDGNHLKLIHIWNNITHNFSFLSVNFYFTNHDFTMIVRLYNIIFI